MAYGRNDNDSDHEPRLRLATSMHEIPTGTHRAVLVRQEPSSDFNGAVVWAYWYIEGPHDSVEAALRDWVGKFIAKNDRAEYFLINVTNGRRQAQVQLVL